MKKRSKALVLMITMLITLIPSVTLKSKEAEAANYVMEGNTTIVFDENKSKELYRATLTPDGLEIRTEFSYSSTAILSYHTKFLYFTAVESDGDPTSLGNKCKTIAAMHKNTEYEGDKTYTTFFVPAATIEGFAGEFFGPDALKRTEGVTLYMSQGFVLKRRSNSKAEWRIDNSPVYNTVEKIQRAAAWTYDTMNNFIGYFDVPIKVTTTTFNFIVKSADNKMGIASSSEGNAKVGSTVTAIAKPNEGYIFTYWEVEQGWVEDGADLSMASLKFIMPATDVTLVAHFEDVPKVLPTRPPINTPTIEPTRSPEVTTTPTPSPIPTVTPIPTPAAPYFPEESDEIYKNHIRYYTTDEGYTMQKIFENNGYLAGMSGPEDEGRIQSNYYIKHDKNYVIGTDSSGNTWYFSPSVTGNNANYVHPKIYKGCDADTAEVRYITELTFPSTIIYNGVNYTVTSIGGGTAGYRAFETGSYNGDESWELDTEKGIYRYYKEHISSSGSTYTNIQTYSAYIRYAYGVVGNGYITSDAHRHFYWYQNGAEKYNNEDYQNDYYVHNTTLKYIVIPDTVTVIEDYAFYGCQALEKVIGGDNVSTIGESAFEASDHLVSKLCQNGPQYSFTYYYYNGSYSFDKLTDVMIAWQNNIALSEYLELETFTMLRTIEAYAFMWHTNLFNVTLPSGVSTILSNAFAGCKLDSIAIPGKNTVITDGENYYDRDGNMYSFGGGSTLGTKGNNETVIITVPESKAMYYGIMYRDYYTLRAGYEVVYDNNFNPREEYISASMLKLLYETAVQDIKISVAGTGTVHLLLDDDGDLFVYTENHDAMATQIAPGTKFTEIKQMSMLHWTGGQYESCNWYFSIGTNGEVWGCTQYTPRSWTDFSMPEGAYSLQFSGNRYYAWIYYLDADGHICCARITENGGSPSPTLRLVEHEKILHNYPTSGTGYKFNRIIVENEGEAYPGATKSINYNGTSYPSGAPPHIIGCTTNNTLVQYVVNPLTSTYESIADNYMPPGTIATGCNGFVWLYKEHSDSVGDYEIYYVNINGILYNVKQQSGGFVTTPIASGGFYDVIDDVNDVLSVLCGNGTVYVANHRNRTAMLLLRGTEIKEMWAYEAAVALSDYNYNTKDCNFLYILDSKNDLYCVYETYGQQSSSLQMFGTTKLVSNVKKILRRDANILVLDGNGDVWSIGVNEYGALANYSSYYNASYGKDSSYCLYTATKINAATTFSDIYLDESNNGPYYSLVQDTNGNVYAAGQSKAIFGDNDYHYSGFVKVSVPMKNSVESVYEFLYGYEFREKLYASMFERDGYDFVSWNVKSDGSGKSYRPGEEIILSTPLKVYAQWEKSSNKIRYAPNGGSGVMDDDVYGLTVTTVTLKKNVYMKKGYEFIEWNTEPDGSGTDYKDMATIAIPHGTTVLYAQWKPFSYIVKVAEDDIRVAPVTITDIFDLNYGEEMTIPAARADKVYTIGYDLNQRGTMSTVPHWKTEPPLSDEYTKATLVFLGWQLYEEDVDGYNYIGFYESGERVKNLAEQKGNALVLFPYWGGDASYVKLPVAECAGYDFVGWTTDKNETDEENVIHAEEGSGARYKPRGDETLYAYYVPKEYTVELIADIKDANPGEITMKQTLATMTFDKLVPNVILPESDRYVFLGYFTEPEGRGELYYDEGGEGVKVWQISDGSVTALYAYMVAEVEVTLDGRGATKQEQKTTTMTYEEVGADVIPPEKTGYSFEGYFTEVRGGGKQYFDKTGKGTSIWLEKDVKVLYACWKQNPIELPKKDAENVPAVLPEDKVEIRVLHDKATVHLYADDNNPSTGAENDLPSYLVSDVVINGKTEAFGAIPSTEKVAIRATMGTWMLSGVMERKSGIDYVRVHVTVPYRTQYEDAEDETLIISNLQTKTLDFMIPKAWSYWIVSEGGIYFPEKVVVENDSIEGKKVEVPVCWDIDEAEKKPAYQLVSYGDKWNHLNWLQFDIDGTPSVSITLTEEQYVISDVPGEIPDVTEHLTIVCSNAAWEDKTQFEVLSDKLSVEDTVLLSDEGRTDGNGAMPDIIAIAEIENKISETTYSQTYQAEIPLLATVKNGRYDTMAEVIYAAGRFNVGNSAEKRIQVTDTNEINIHTPVMCMVQIAAGHDREYQCGEIPKGSSVLVLDEEGIYSEFTLQISNTGYHSSKKGYGMRSYASYVAQKDGKEQNQVRFPFAVWIDVGNDGKNENDVLWREKTWYTIGTEKQRFYVPFWIKEGEYEIELRSVAVNALDATEKVEKVRNTQQGNYVATETINVYLTGRLYDFTVYDIGGTAAWEDVREENVSYTVGIAETDSENEEARDLWDTLPLRTGVHPLYRNAGGLPIGGNFSFRLKSIGSFSEEDTILSIVPELVCLTEQGYEEVDVYFEKETEQGTFLTKWSDEECSFCLLTEIDSQPDTECIENLKKTDGGKNALESYGEEIGEAIRYWTGTFSVPDTIYVAEQGSDVLGYQKKYGLSFEEDFWVDNERLMLRFCIRLENSDGDELYYGKIPEHVKNNIWCQEAGSELRTDIEGGSYPIYGGEVAVIYPGESGRKEYTTHGIY